MSVDELKHHFRILDQTLSMHCAIRDGHQGKALWMDIIQMVAATLLLAAVFIDPEMLRFWHFNVRAAQTIVGGSSVVLFLLSLIVLRVDWKRQAERYGRSSETLASLKGNCRALLDDGAEQDPAKVDELNRECRRVLSQIPVVPENRFHVLKAHHQRKVALSKMISEYPGANVTLMKLLLFFRANRALVFGKRNRGDADGKAN